MDRCKQQHRSAVRLPRSLHEHDGVDREIEYGQREKHRAVGVVSDQKSVISAGGTRRILSSHTTGRRKNSRCRRQIDQSATQSSGTLKAGSKSKL